MPEPTSVLPPPPTAKPATRAALHDAPSTMNGMPDPTTIEDAEPATLSPGDADDLIAKLADEQIDRLLADEADGAPPTFAAPAAVAVPQPAAVEAIATTPLEAPFVERRNVASAAFPSSFSPPGAKAAAPVEPTTSDVVSNQSLADLHDAVASPVDAHAELRSDAAAVADELTADLARSPARVAPAPPPKPAPVVAHEEGPSAIGRAVHAIGVVPTAIVDVINLPVRAANDGAREAIGAIAIVTLANAAALLLYLMIFQR